MFFLKLNLLIIFPLWILKWKKSAIMVYLNRFLISKKITSCWLRTERGTVSMSQCRYCLSFSCLHSGGTACFVLSICFMKSGLSHYREVSAVRITFILEPRSSYWCQRVADCQQLETPALWCRWCSHLLWLWSWCIVNNFSWIGLWPKQSNLHIEPNFSNFSCAFCWKLLLDLFLINLLNWICTKNSFNFFKIC